MKKFACIGKKFQHQSFLKYMSTKFYVLVKGVNSFWVQLGYFMVLSSLGFLALKFSSTRTSSSSVSLPLKDLDVFFTSVSAATISSMASVEMEVFSNGQLIVMTMLMLAGGEVFTSIIQLYLMRFPDLRDPSKIIINSGSTDSSDTDNDQKRFSCPVLGSNPNSIHSIEMHSVRTVSECNEGDPEKGSIVVATTAFPCETDMKDKVIRCLGKVVLSYLVISHVLGSSLVAVYLTAIPSARDVLRNKGLSLNTFAVFTVVATFANCGFVPTNENMMIFKPNSGLLLLLIPLILMGNTLYPTCLRLILQALKKVTKREEYEYLLRSSGKEIGYLHLFTRLDAWLLGVTVFGFIVVQLVLFCAMEWKTDVMKDMSPYQKLVAALFQTVNSRHTGESVFDISTVSPAILAMFIVMMYLPPYTSFLLAKEDDGKDIGKLEGERIDWSFMEYLKFSQLSYLAIFIILVCITERENLKTDPLNYNVLNITIEIVSAYGNVGFSTGYSCERQIHPDGLCKDACIGFVGKWSNGGKFILIIVMIFGRFKKFNMRGGKAWKLL